MNPTKYLTSINLGFYSKGLIFLHPNNINDIEKQNEETQEISNDCHIYFIGKRPRISIKENSICLKENELTGVFQFSEKGKLEEEGFRLDNLFNVKEVKLPPFPFNKIILKLEGGKECTILAHILSSMCSMAVDSKLNDLEIVYVGMSYADGKRSAKDRLKSHSTLQNVLSDINFNAPEMEAFVILAQYETPQTFIQMLPPNVVSAEIENRDLMSALTKQDENIVKDLQIKIIEAGLISYFKPEYNEIYKSSFPSSRHVILDHVYEIDYEAIIVEFNTEDIKCKTFSKYRKKGFHHIAYFDLHQENNRNNFYKFITSSDSNKPEDMSGPLF